MPSLSKIASFHSVSQSPRHKTGWYGSTPDIRPDPDRHGGGGADPRLQPPGGGVEAAGNHNHNHYHQQQPANGQSAAVSSAAVPTLPDVQLSRAQFTQQWSFLHALLAQDEAERLDDSRVIEVSEPRDGGNDSSGNNDTAAADAAVTDFSGRGRRSVVVTAEGAERRGVCRQGDGLFTLDGETTDRSAGKRVAHLSTSAAAALSAGKGGHRVSRRSGRLSGRLTASSPTPRQGPHGSGSGSAKTPMEYSKRRLSPSGGDAGQSIFRKPSSPTTTLASISAENTARTHKYSEEKSFGSSGQAQRKSTGSAAVVTHGDQTATQAYRPKSPGVTPDTTLPPSSLTSVSSRAGAAGTRKLSGAAGAAAVGTGAGDNKTPAAASHLVNQWTVCRALEDLGEDEDDEAGSDTAEKIDDEFLGQPSKLSDTWSQHEVPRVGVGEAALRGGAGAGDGVFSRAASSTNLSRRKRPLLLPPIMLPPIYTAKPTPLRLRDEVCFMGASPRARRQISDEEWENLKDCRYLRIRTVKRSLRV